MKDVLKIQNDPIRGEVKIENVRYAYEIFRFFADSANKGKVFQFINGDGETITIAVLENQNVNR